MKPIKIIINRKDTSAEQKGWEYFSQALEQAQIDTDNNLLITIKEAENTRSVAQNRLSFMWYKELADQGDMTAEEYRSLCKLEIGVPILRMEDEEFRAQYDSVIRPLEYEQKLTVMKPPIDLPVTSRMKVKAFTQYLEQVEKRFVEQGFVLTRPIDIYEQALGK